MLQPAHQALSIGTENIDPQQHLEESDNTQKQPSLGGASTSVFGISNKILPLKQLKDIITDICASKQRYDQKAREMGLPMETMEQYMYTYLV